MRNDVAARFYELMVIASPEGTPEELVGVVDQITGYVEAAGGSILRANYDSPWGRRRLAYPIRHESQDVRDGFYTLVHLQVEPDKVATIERDLKLNDRLMRYLVLQLAAEPVFPEPTEDESVDAERAATGQIPEGDVEVAEASDTESAENDPESRRTVTESAQVEPEEELTAVEDTANPDVDGSNLSAETTIPSTEADLVAELVSEDEDEKE